MSWIRKSLNINHNTGLGGNIAVFLGDLRGFFSIIPSLIFRDSRLKSLSYPLCN
jgi:hypothetical protein